MTEKEPRVLCLDDDGKPRIFKMKQITGHMDMELEQQFSVFLPDNIKIVKWPELWVKRFSVTTVEMKEDGVTEIPMNQERVATLPPAIYNRLKHEYNILHGAIAADFLGNSAVSPAKS